MEFNKLAPSSTAGVYCLIGDPVDHSLSPAMQNAAFRSAGIDAIYVALRVKDFELRRAVHGMQAVGFRGFNVTTPHKTRIMRYLDKVDSQTADMHSVNTVVANEGGGFVGHNTDGIGAVKALEGAKAPIDGDILLLGAGGAARSIAFALAPHARSINIVNRSLPKARDLVGRLKRSFHLDVKSYPLTRAGLRGFIREAELFINASSMGMDGKADAPIERDWLNENHWVMDIVYRPEETRLLRLARSAGARTVDGLDMLVGQGACSFELWTGRRAPIAEMRRVVAERSLAFPHAKNS